jgi:hypothetical protein
MNLKYMNKSELDTRIKSLVGRERELLHEILLTIQHIDQRKIYLDLGHASLYAYLTVGVGYSESSAFRRIQAARLLQELKEDAPELGAKIQSGAVNLNQIALVQKAARQAESALAGKISSKKITSAEKSELIMQIENMNSKDSEKCVASFFDLPILGQTKVKTQKDDSIRVELTLSKALAEKIQQAQGLLAHAVPSNDLVDFISYLADQVIKQKTSVCARAAKKDVAPAAVAENITAAARVKAVAPSDSAFSARTKKITLKEQPCCQYRDPKTNKLCGSKWFLQIDHKQSCWVGGNNYPDSGDGRGHVNTNLNAPKNAQTFCQSHNLLKYRQEAGIKSLVNHTLTNHRSK